jgi:hypothetical protein
MCSYFTIKLPYHIEEQYSSKEFKARYFKEEDYTE